MSALTLTLEAADRADPQHTEVRTLAYKAAPYIALGDNTDLLHTRHDAPGTQVLGLWQGDRLEATLALSPYTREADLSADLHVPGPLPFWHSPGGILCRGATRPTAGGLGLMSFLVGESVGLARRMGLASMYGIQPSEGVTHRRTMLRQGWSARDVSTAHFPVKVNTPHYTLVWLPATRFAGALEDAARHRLHAVVVRALDGEHAPRIARDAAGNDAHLAPADLRRAA